MEFWLYQGAPSTIKGKRVVAFQRKDSQILGSVQSVSEHFYYLYCVIPTSREKFIVLTRSVLYTEYTAHMTIHYQVWGTVNDTFNKLNKMNTDKQTAQHTVRKDLVHIILFHTCTAVFYTLFISHWFTDHSFLLYRLR